MYVYVYAYVYVSVYIYIYMHVVELLSGPSLAFEGSFSGPSLLKKVLVKKHSKIAGFST